MWFDFHAPLSIFSPIVFGMCWSGRGGIGKIRLTLVIHFQELFPYEGQHSLWGSPILFVIPADLVHFQKVCCALVEVLPALAYMGQYLSHLS